MITSGTTHCDAQRRLFWEMGIDMMKWDKMYCTQFSFHSRYPSWVTEVLKRWRGEVWAMTNGSNLF